LAKLCHPTRDQPANFFYISLDLCIILDDEIINFTCGFTVLLLILSRCTEQSKKSAKSIVKKFKKVWRKFNYL